MAKPARLLRSWYKSPFVGRFGRRDVRGEIFAGAVLTVSVLVAAAGIPEAQAGQSAPRQKIDEEYTAKIKEYLQDPRITTELVDHLPASDTVPSPLKFLGRSRARPAS